MADLPLLGDADLVLDGQAADVRLAAGVTEAALQRTMSSEASTLALTVADEGWAILRDPAVLGSRRLSTGVRLDLHGLQWSLEEVEKVDLGEELTFWDPAVAKLAGEDKIVKASRGSKTRAQFAEMLCRRAGVAFVSPDKDVLQPVEDLSKEDQKALREARESRSKQNRTRSSQARGVLSGKGLTIKGRKATRAQLRNVEIVLEVCDELGAKNKARLAAVIGPIGESEFKTDAVNPKSGASGVHQLLATTAADLGISPSDTRATAQRFLRGGFTGGKAGKRGAMDLAPGMPGASAGALVTAVEGSDANGAFYDEHRKEGLAILAAWSPGDGGEHFEQRTGTPDTARVDRFEFRVEPGENWWQCLVRLADQVSWRCFAVGGRVYFVSDLTLIAAAPAIAFEEGQDGCESIRWLFTRGRRVDEATVVVRGAKRLLLPGQVALVRGEGAADGRWLVRELDADLKDDTREIVYTLGQAQDPKPEPASTVTTKAGEDPARADARTAGAGSSGKAKGKVSVAAGAESNGKLQPEITEFLELMAGRTDEPVVVTTGTNHSKFTLSGNISQHFSGDAVDLGLGGDARTDRSVRRRGDKLAIAALRVCGLSYSEAGRVARSGGIHNLRWRNYSVQVIWLTLDGGNHFNHVHVGLGGTA